MNTSLFRRFAFLATPVFSIPIGFVFLIFKVYKPFKTIVEDDSNTTYEVRTERRMGGVRMADSVSTQRGSLFPLFIFIILVSFFYFIGETSWELLKDIVASDYVYLLPIGVACTVYGHVSSWLKSNDIQGDKEREDGVKLPIIIIVSSMFITLVYAFSKHSGAANVVAMTIVYALTVTVPVIMSFIMIIDLIRRFSMKNAGVFIAPLLVLYGYAYSEKLDADMQDIVNERQRVISKIRGDVEVARGTTTEQKKVARLSGSGKVVAKLKRDKVPIPYFVAIKDGKEDSSLPFSPVIYYVGGGEKEKVRYEMAVTPPKAFSNNYSMTESVNLVFKDGAKKGESAPVGKYRFEFESALYEMAPIERTLRAGPTKIKVPVVGRKKVSPQLLPDSGLTEEQARLVEMMEYRYFLVIKNTREDVSNEDLKVTLDWYPKQDQGEWYNSIVIYTSVDYLVERVHNRYGDFDDGTLTINFFAEGVDIPSVDIMLEHGVNIVEVPKS
ncbi:hypothetical protein [uncultured Alteromonas sp.]|uniref:hypothetical protein n=1 Tax=uncultured Alteromonas sp. TaxID=179113 RepID=UPI0030CA6C6D|tara:strand:- start:216 stop:1706 length:1491 start_codon:yes stop_codon:yes gene_type:complete